MDEWMDGWMDGWLCGVRRALTGGKIPSQKDQDLNSSSTIHKLFDLRSLTSSRLNLPVYENKTVSYVLQDCCKVD